MMMKYAPGATLMTLGLTLACGRSAAWLDGVSQGSSGGVPAADSIAPDPTAPQPPASGTGSGPGVGESTGTPIPMTTAPGDSDTTGVPPPPGGECCEPHLGPGCDESEVAECVCNIVPSCCAFEWDRRCVTVAINECNAQCDPSAESTETGDPGTSTGDTDTDDPSGACEQIIEIEMVPSQAQYSGAWTLGMSQIGEGEISVLDQAMGFGGSFVYEPEIPCADTWYIWTRYWQSGGQDSYFATLDGAPMPEAIFEGDCQPDGEGYDWSVLNWRAQGSGACVYVEDPWAPQWEAGLHSIEFSFRESFAMGRILITNDPNFVP